MRIGPLYVCWKWKQGVIWWRFFGAGYALKAPWNFPMFSERNGYLPIIFKFRGWRLMRLTR